MRHSPADGVRDIYRRGPSINGCLTHFDEVIRLGTGGILRRKFDIGYKLTSTLHSIDSELDDLALRLAEFELTMKL